MNSVVHRVAAHASSLLRCAIASAAIAAIPGSVVAQGCNGKGGGIEPAVYRKLLNDQFAKLVSPQSSSIVGTFAALDVKEADVTFAGTTVFDRGSILGVKLHGGAADGILPIIDKQEVNGKFGGEIQLNLLNRRRDTLQYRALSRQAYCAAMRKIVNDSALREIEIKHNYLDTLKKLELLAFDKKLAVIKDSIDKASGPRKDSLQVEYEKTQRNKQFREETPVPYAAQQVVTRNNAAIDEREKLPALIEVKGFTLGWWSLGYGVENVSHKLFNPAAPFDSQVSKGAYASHTVKVQYSRYSVGPSPFDTYFWSVGVHGSLGDNLGELKSVELTDTKSFGPNPDDRVSIKKYTVSQGAYEKNLKTLRLVGDYYWFFLNGSRAAVHMYPEIEMKDGAGTAYALGLGFLIAGKKDEKSAFNAELYFNLVDLTDVRESDKTTLGRSGFGARFTFPITFTPRS